MISDANVFQKCRSSNSNDASFPSKIPTTTEPTGDGVIDCVVGGFVPSGVRIIPYGLGSDNDAFSMRVIGWVRSGSTPGTNLWIPTILAEFSCTISTAVGVAAMDVINTERFADTITGVTGIANTDYVITSPTGNVVASVLVDLKGSHKVEICFDQTTGTPTMNALVAKV